MFRDRARRRGLGSETESGVQRRAAAGPGCTGCSLNSWSRMKDQLFFVWRERVTSVVQNSCKPKDSVLFLPASSTGKGPANHRNGRTDVFFLSPYKHTKYTLKQSSRYRNNPLHSEDRSAAQSRQISSPSTFTKMPKKTRALKTSPRKVQAFEDEWKYLFTFSQSIFFFVWNEFPVVHTHFLAVSAVCLFFPHLYPLGNSFAKSLHCVVQQERRLCFTSLS